MNVAFTSLNILAFHNLFYRITCSTLFVLFEGFSGLCSYKLFYIPLPNHFQHTISHMSRLSQQLPLPVPLSIVFSWC
ncbi:mCG148448 [Mus musculus]|nr:mCG148448 [Mus musculus]